MFKPYKGDLFGTNGNKSGGLLYLSRMNVEDDPVVKAQSDMEKEVRAPCIFGSRCSSYVWCRLCIPFCARSLI